ncbi:hypothetical protein WFJ45_24600, partial [Salmonella enterica subsp. enterica serovar Minnesota]|uniref:hypothetical protein n=1 Tax=Salmonella enterica TaxID=28901 RepID=UPI003D2D59E6
FSVNWSNPPVGVTQTSVGFNFPYPLPDAAPPASTASSGTVSFRYPKNAVNGIEYSVYATGTGNVSTS